jgi:hypothetical protein
MLAAKDAARCGRMPAKRLGPRDMGAPLPIWSGITTTANST